jgi:hypothetical protein
MQKTTCRSAAPVRHRKAGCLPAADMVVIFLFEIIVTAYEIHIARRP